MRQLIWAALLVVATAVTAGVQAAGKGEQGPTNFSAQLISYNEVPAVSSVAVGSVTLAIDDDAGTIAYRLAFSGLEGTVTQSHVHLGQPDVNGGIMLWLCGSATNPGPAGTPACPAGGEVSRLLGPADVVGPAGQGVSPTEFAEAVAAIRAGVAYANVHSTMWLGGEIRGQLRPGGGHQ
jgi:hypothetical protein